MEGFRTLAVVLIIFGLLTIIVCFAIRSNPDAYGPIRNEVKCYLGYSVLMILAGVGLSLGSQEGSREAAAGQNAQS